MAVPSTDTITAFTNTLSKPEWMVIGKLQQMEVADLLGAEIRRAFAGANQWRMCHRILKQLMQRGFTFEMLTALSDYESPA